MAVARSVGTDSVGPADGPGVWRDPTVLAAVARVAGFRSWRPAKPRSSAAGGDPAASADRGTADPWLAISESWVFGSAMPSASALEARLPGPCSSARPSGTPPSGAAVPPDCGRVRAGIGAWRRGLSGGMLRGGIWSVEDAVRGGEDHGVWGGPDGPPGEPGPESAAALPSGSTILGVSWPPRCRAPARPGRLSPAAALTPGLREGLEPPEAPMVGPPEAREVSKSADVGRRPGWIGPGAPIDSAG